jgi:hypothetical protein
MSRIAVLHLRTLTCFSTIIPQMFTVLVTILRLALYNGRNQLDHPKHSLLTRSATEEAMLLCKIHSGHTNPKSV